jgi:hypothetical protein
MRRGAWVAAAGVLAAASALASVLGAQSLANRIDAVRDGMVQISFATRPGVCGDGHGSTWTSGRAEISSHGGRYTCIAGPARVSIGKADGRVASVRSCVACRPRSSSIADVDLGTVEPAEAARYLIGVAPTLGGTSAGAAIAAASFADGVDLVPELTRLVRDPDATTAARKDALFWLGQRETEKTQDLIGLYASLEPQVLREHFTFVLSQRSDDPPALDKLIDIAQHDADLTVRKQAMFWLGQSKDPKAVKFFQTILMR